MKHRTLMSAGMLVVVLMLLAVAMPASAAGEGNALRVGPGQEYETIQEAVNAAKQGSRIFVYPAGGDGWYPESVSVTKNNLEIVAQGDGDSVIVWPPDTQHGAGFDVHADHVTIRGFEIWFGGRHCNDGIYFEGSHNTFADNYVTLGPVGCIGAQAIVCEPRDGGSDHNIIEHNTIDQTEVGIAVGVWGGAADINRGNIIRDNTLKNIDGVGIGISGARGFLISGNSSHGNQGYGIDIANTADSTMVEGYHSVVNNRIGYSQAYGISVYAFPGTVLTNNRIAENFIDYGSGDDGLLLEADTGAVLTHNQVVSNTIGLAGRDGMALNALDGGMISDNLIRGNLIYHSQRNGIFLSADSDNNRILNNEVQTNDLVGVAVFGDDNLFVGNWVFNNTLDLQDFGVGNRWHNNTYDTSN